MQKKDRHPLVFKEGSDKPSELQDSPIVSQRKGKQSKAQYIEPGNSDEANNITNGVLTTTGTGKKKETTVISLPKSPHSVTPTPMRRRIFLTSLSDDEHYKRLILLLHAAKVSNILLVSALTDI